MFSGQNPNRTKEATNVQLTMYEHAITLFRALNKFLHILEDGVTHSWWVIKLIEYEYNFVASSLYNNVTRSSALAQREAE